jgi:dGTPase
LKFEGNAQSLRLVAKLQILADDSGLNLTFGSLSALSKYVASSDQADRNATDRALRKPGYFASETQIVEDLRDATGTGEARNPICLLVEAADDIVYLAADVEDAVKKGVLSWSKVEEQLNAQKAPSVKDALHVQAEILKAGQSSVPGDLDDDIWASAFRTAAISVMAGHASRVFQDRYDDIMEGRYRGSLLKDSDAADLEDRLRNIGMEHVYPTRSTLQLELMGRHVIGDLMDVFWEGAEAMPSKGDPSTSTFAGKAAMLISSNYRRVLQDSLNKARLPAKYCRLQLVTDYICGMTDSFATNLHAELFNGR